MSRVVDIDRGFDALMMRLEALADGAQITCGVHEDDGAVPHDKDTSVLDVATFVEFGTEHMPARSYVRSTIDDHEREFTSDLLKAAEETLRGREIEEAFGDVAFEVADRMKLRTPEESGKLWDAVTGRVRGQAVSGG